MRPIFDSGLLAVARGRHDDRGSRALHPQRGLTGRCRPSACRRSTMAAMSSAAMMEAPDRAASSSGCSARARSCCAPTRPIGARRLEPTSCSSSSAAGAASTSRRSPRSPASWRSCWAPGRISTAPCASSSTTPRSPRARTILGNVRDKVRAGSSLAAALAAEPRSFSELYVGLVRAGEAGGTLPATLDRLATLLERERSLSANLRVGADLPGPAGGRGDRLDRAAARLRAAAIRADLRAGRRPAAGVDPRADDRRRRGRRRRRRGCSLRRSRRSWLGRPAAAGAARLPAAGRPRCCCTCRSSAGCCARPWRPG